MLPSPSRLQHHDFSKPISCASKNTYTYSQLPFISPPSRLIRHTCPTFQPSTSPNNTSPKPLTTLLLSLPLAQKIHQLLLASRQIEQIVRGYFGGEIKEQDVTRKMSVLEEKYDRLREEVECELESAWVNAGFLPEKMGEVVPAFPPSHKARATKNAQFVKGSKKVRANENYTVDKAVKRKQGDRDSRQNAKKRKLQGNGEQEMGSEVEVDRSEWQFNEVSQPIGIQQAMLPLGFAERKRLKEWNWGDAGRGRFGAGSGEMEEGCVSPRGGGVSTRWV